MYAHSLRATRPFTTTVDWGICDRCGFLYDLDALPFQYDVRGQSLHNTGLRVCHRCYDEPAWFLAPPLIIGPEGVVRDPRPNHYAQQMAGTGPALPLVPNSPLDGVITD